MKRLRFLFWAFLVCLENELEPLYCPSPDPTCTEGCCYCELHEGHPGKHISGASNTSWQ